MAYLGLGAVTLPTVRPWTTLGVSPPGRDAEEFEHLRFVRNLHIRSILIFTPIALALFIVFGLPPFA